MQSFILRLIFLVTTCLGPTLGRGTVASPESALAEGIVAAPDDAARDALLAGAASSDSGKVRDALGEVQQRAFFSGDLAESEVAARYLEKLAAAAGDQTGVYSARVRLASVYRELGEFSDATALMAPALAYFQDHHDVRRTVSALMARGIVSIYQADYARALSDFKAALTLSEANGYREGAIPALNSIGEVYREQGEPARALDYYAQARKWVGDDTAWNNAFIFNNIAESYLGLGDFDKAIDYLERSGRIAEKTGQKPRAATELAVLGDVRRRLRQYDAARESFERSRGLSQEIHDPAGEGRAQLGLAETEGADGHHALALERAQQSVGSYRRANQPEGLGSALTALGHEQRALGRPDEAQAAFDEAIAVTESVRGRLAGGDLEAQAYFEGKVTPYQETVALQAARPGGAAAALQTAERAKARALLDIVRRASVDSASTLTAEEHAREGVLNRRLAAANHRMTVALADPAARPDDARRELEQARADLDQFQQDLFAAHPQMAARQPTAAALSSQDFEDLTDHSHVALLEFVVTDDATYALAVTAAEVQVFPITISRDELTRRTAALRNALASRSIGWQGLARSLYDDLLKPSAPAWTNSSHLVIVPDGPLWNLPFQALASGPDRCLWEDCAISYAPSLTLLKRSIAQAPPTDSPRLLAMGNPAAGGRFAALPETGRQLAALANLYPPDRYRSYLGAAAQEDTFKREAGDFDLLQLATHGILNDQNPLYSYLLMSQADLAPDEDGLLEARELMGLHLHARLAVLSACETGRGRIGAGEGLLGLSWAFFSAGCPAVIVSQWKVDSASTTDLMVGLHKRLLAGDSPAEALRGAALELSKNPKYRHPFYWAPFVLMGANQPVASSSLLTPAAQSIGSRTP